MKKNSYMIIDKVTNTVVMEVFDIEVVYLVNKDKYKILTAYDYLCQINKVLQINKM